MKTDLIATIHALYDLSKTVSASPRQFLAGATERIAHLMGMGVALVTFWEGGGEFSIMAGYNVPPELLAMKRLKMDGCFCEWIVKNELPLVIPNTMEDERSARHPIATAYHFRSYIGIPLISHQKGKGTLCLLDKRPGSTFSELDVKVLTILGAIICSCWEGLAGVE